MITRVNFAIDLNAKLRFRAVEVEYIAAERMLIPENQFTSTLLQP